MRTFVTTGVGVLTLVTMLGPTPGSTATMCADVESAKVVLSKHAAAGGDSRAAARSQDVQSPRSNDVQAPRGNEVQAPRNQDLQAPRDQEIQSPRGGSSQRGAPAPRSPEYREAATLVKEAEAACEAGNTTVASEKARAAMARLQR